MKKQKNKRVKINENTLADWKMAKKAVLKSKWFWIALVLSVAFLAVSIAAIVQASVRYQGFYEAAKAFNSSWEQAEHAHSPWFQVLYNGKHLDYWTTTNPLTYVPASVSANPVLATKTITGITYYQTTFFALKDYPTEVEVADNEIWFWLAQPLFGKNPANPTVYKNLVSFYATSEAQPVNLSFLASLWPNSMNMNYGYWIIAGFFFLGFGITGVTISWFIIKLLKNKHNPNLNKTKKDQPGLDYIEASTDNVHDEIENEIHSREDLNHLNHPNLKG